MVCRFLFTSLLLFPFITLFSQTNSDQNGLKTSVTNTLYANATQARRYEIATVAYNSYHWQHGGLIIIELYDQYYGTGYEKYIVENGFGQGANSGTSVVKLVESFGLYHNARITLGDAVDLGSSYAGYINKVLPIFLDVREYSGYKVRITYLQDMVGGITNYNQIKINENPNPVDIPDFTVSQELYNDKGIVSSGNLRISGSGNHYIQKGNVGIGTTTPDSKLTVKGTIHAEEVKVDLNIPAADYVFEPDYALMPLSEVKQFVEENKHLPGVPSGKEMEANGINVSEMNMLLLKKVEELTLHLIEQNKANELQNRAIEALKQEIATLKK